MVTQSYKDECHVVFFYWKEIRKSGKLNTKVLKPFWMKLLSSPKFLGKLVANDCYWSA